MKYCLYWLAVLIQGNPFYATLNLTFSRNGTSVPSERSFWIIITEKDFADCNILLNVLGYLHTFNTIFSYNEKKSNNNNNQILIIIIITLVK